LAPSGPSCCLKPSSWTEAAMAAAAAAAAEEEVVVVIMPEQLVLLLLGDVAVKMVGMPEEVVQTR